MFLRTTIGVFATLVCMCVSSPLLPLSLAYRHRIAVSDTVPVQWPLARGSLQCTAMRFTAVKTHQCQSGAEVECVRDNVVPTFELCGANRPVSFPPPCRPSPVSTLRSGESKTDHTRKDPPEEENKPHTQAEELTHPDTPIE